MSTGNKITRTLSIPFFQSIDLQDDINVVLTQDTVIKAEIETYENLLPFISAKVDNKLLTIKNLAKCGWLRNPAASTTIYLHVSNLDQIIYNGFGTVKTSNKLQANVFFLSSKQGAGNIELNINCNQIYANIDAFNASFTLGGNAAYVSAFCDTRGSFDFSKLQTKKMELWYAGSGDAKVNVSDSLRITIYRNGNVYLRGNPFLIEEKYKSTGRLIKY